MAVEPTPHRDWLRHTRRALDLIDNQVRMLRKRQVIAAYKLLPRTDGPAWRDGTYWGIWSDIDNYPIARTLPCPEPQTRSLAALPTRLARVPALTQERLINWGYAICDAAIRCWVVPDARPPDDFPYPRTGIG
jgi:NTE family protein